MGALIAAGELRAAVAAGAEHWVRGWESGAARYPILRWDGSPYPHGLTGSVLLWPDGRMTPVYGLPYEGGFYGWPTRAEIDAARTGK